MGFSPFRALAGPLFYGKSFRYPPDLRKRRGAPSENPTFPILCDRTFPFYAYSEESGLTSLGLLYPSNKAPRPFLFLQFSLKPPRSAPSLGFSNFFYLAPRFPFFGDFFFTLECTFPCVCRFRVQSFKVLGASLPCSGLFILSTSPKAENAV